ncbi:VOC family protein [Arenimonas soli]|uniref:VOC family protein n=1 Tax=Arenimonas soli TaxID=2269504 RepID=A0ABQ1HG11_9GAMM|nr:VOC family protein [Arenimonas soli]GGA76103.1 VOC family protein [Arenimonas soli]
MAITALHPYLSFQGTCEEAFAHYAKVLGARNTGIFRYGEAPPEPDDKSHSSPEGCNPNLPPGFDDKVMNTCLVLGDLMLMGSDCPPAMWREGGNMTVSLQVSDEAEAERLFAGLMEGSSDIQMPMGETFWAKRFGMGVDRFGTPWMVNCSREG